MLQLKMLPSLLVVLMGSADCLTTVVGILYFGAVECNPLLAGIISANLPAFVALKLTTTVFVGLIFRQVDKTLMRAQNKQSRSFKMARFGIKAAFVGVVALLVIVVINNLTVLAQAICY